MKKLLVVLGLLAAGPAFGQAGLSSGNFGINAVDATLPLAATTTSSSVTFVGQGVNAADVLIYNSGTTLAFARCGPGAQTAVVPSTTGPTVGSVPLPPGTVQAFHKKAASDTCAAIMASGTATIYFSPAYGQ